MNAVETADRFLGCLFGLAIGDALGAPVEFLSLEEIHHAYGERGISGFQPWGGFPPGSYTDDTQMSLATAFGLIVARSKGTDPTAAIHRYYLDWRRSQEDPANRRAPGKTCMAALETERKPDADLRINDSKGCGGVMRAAPIGLAMHPQAAFEVGVQAAALTHGNPSGTLPAGFLACLISRVRTGEGLIDGISFALEELHKRKDIGETSAAVENALRLASSRISVDEGIRELGEGWIAPEALAVPLFSALRAGDDFRKGVLAAVNHGGDSDSTGSIAGAVLGTLLGIDAVPPDWIPAVENAEMLQRTALYLCRDPIETGKDTVDALVKRVVAGIEDGEMSVAKGMGPAAVSRLIRKRIAGELVFWDDGKIQELRPGMQSDPARARLLEECAGKAEAALREARAGA